MYGKGVYLSHASMLYLECPSANYRLMHEPRGHRDMYGAVLVAETELTRSGEADIGVLFMHNGKVPYLVY